MKVYKQESDISCGVACLRSIFAYFGKELSEKQILSVNKFFIKDTKSMSNPTISLGVTALKFGFNVKYIGFNPIIANGNKLSDLKDSLIEKQKSYFELGKFTIESAIEFLELGGELIIERLNIEKLKQLIDNNKFLIVRVKPAFYKNANLHMNHMLIIDGYNKDSFHILDPANAEQYNLDYDTFLMAFYGSLPEVLIINRKD